MHGTFWCFLQDLTLSADIKKATRGCIQKLCHGGGAGGGGGGGGAAPIYSTGITSPNLRGARTTQGGEYIPATPVMVVRARAKLV